MRNATTEEILQKIYDSEINLSIGWMWDGGIEYAIADLMYLDGEVKNTGTNSIHEAVIIIADDVKDKYPNSSFAKWWNCGLVALLPTNKVNQGLFRKFIQLYLWVIPKPKRELK